MASTMETFAKVAGVTSMATGGIENLRKIITGEAKMLKNQQKRQRAELKEHTALMIAEEKDVHANWLREKGSLIQAMKDRGTGYEQMSQEERELAEELRIEKIKQKQIQKKLFWREQASKMGGLEESEWIDQHQFNLDTKAARQAEKDLIKKEKSDLKRDELRIAELAAGYHRLGAFDGMDKKDIAATIRKLELKDKANERDDEIAKVDEKYLGESKKRYARMIVNLKSDEEYSGKFKNMSDEAIILEIQKAEAKQKEIDRLNEIAKAEKEILGEASPSAEPTSPAGSEPEEGESPTVEPENTGGDVTPGAGSGSGDVISAIEEQTAEIVHGLGTHSPPFLETLTKDGVAVTSTPPTVEGENIGIESAPDTNSVNGSDVVQPVILTDHEGDPVVTESEQMTSLLAIEDKKMDYLRRGEARDVKRMRLAVEAKRDKGRPLPTKPLAGAPTLNKDEGGGLLSTLGKIFMSPLGRIGMALTGLTTGVGVLGTATGLLTNATSTLGNFANKLLPNWMKKMLPAPGSPTTGGAPKLTKAGKIDGRGQSAGSKATRFQKGWNNKAGQETLKHTSKISKGAGRATKLLGRAAVPLSIALEAFNMYSTEQREDLDRTEKNIKHTESVGGMGGAAAGSAMGAAIGTVIFPGVGTIIGGMIGGGLGYFLGGEISKTVAEEVSDKTDLATADERLGELPESDQKLLMKEAERQGAVDVGLGHGTIDDLEKLSKLDLSTIESLLDQETWEKEDKEQLLKIRAAKKEGRQLHFKDGGFWDDDTLEAGEKGTAGPSINVEEKLEKLRKKEAGRGRGFQQRPIREETEEDKIAQEYEDKEREELQAKPDSELDNADLRKKYNIKGRFTKSKVRRAKRKMALKKKAQQLKDAGRTKGTFKGGVLVPEKGDQQQLSVDDEQEQADEKDWELKRKLASGEITQGQYTEQKYGMSQEQRTAAAQQLGGPGATGTTTVDVEPVEVISNALTEEGLRRSTPDVDKQDSANKAMLDTGSIFTHDTHLETALWSIWAEEKSFFDPKTLNASTVDVEGEKELPLAGLPGEPGESTDFAPQLNMFGNQPDLMAPVPVIDVSPNAPAMGTAAGVVPSGMLEQSLITEMMAMQKQVDTGTGGAGANMVNAPTVVNNDNSQMIQSGSTAHAGVTKPGTGRG